LIEKLFFEVKKANAVVLCLVEHRMWGWKIDMLLVRWIMVNKHKDLGKDFDYYLANLDGPCQKI